MERMPLTGWIISPAQQVVFYLYGFFASQLTCLLQNSIHESSAGPLLSHLISIKTSLPLGSGFSFPVIGLHWSSTDSPWSFMFLLVRQVPGFFCGPFVWLDLYFLLSFLAFHSFLPYYILQSTDFNLFYLAWMSSGGFSLLKVLFLNMFLPLLRCSQMLLRSEGFQLSSQSWTRRAAMGLGSHLSHTASVWLASLMSSSRTVWSVFSQTIRPI